MVLCLVIDRKMNGKYKVVIFAVLVAAAEAGSVAKSPGASLSDNEKTWEGLGVRADVNQYIDSTISMLVPFIRENGLDPMNLPDIQERVQVRPVWITYSASLNLYQGQLSGLVNIARSGDQRINYFAKMLRLRLQFQFTDLEFTYRYNAAVMNLGPRGRINGSLERFVVVIDLLLDFNNDQLQLQEFSLTDIGRLRIRVAGNVLVDWFVNPVVSLVTRIFDSTIMRAVQSNIRSAIQGGLDSVNSNIVDIVNRLEAYGKQ